MAVYGVPEGRDRRLGRRPVAGIPGRPSGALAIVVLARFPVSAQNRHAGLAFIAALRGNLLYFPVFSASLHCRLAWQSPVFPCFFCKDEKHAARGRTRGRATKNPARHAVRALGVVSVNTLSWKILVTRVKRKMGLPLSH
jgi:hypothetical protein